MCAPYGALYDFLHFPKDDRCFRKITFCDVETGEVYTDLMEIYVLEIGKLPTEDRNESGIIRWMRFLNGKCKEDLKKKIYKGRVQYNVSAFKNNELLNKLIGITINNSSNI